MCSKGFPALPGRILNSTEVSSPVDFEFNQIFFTPQFSSLITPRSGDFSDVPCLPEEAKNPTNLQVSQGTWPFLVCSNFQTSSRQSHYLSFMSLNEYGIKSRQHCRFHFCRYIAWIDKYCICQFTPIIYVQILRCLIKSAELNGNYTPTQINFKGT